MRWLPLLQAIEARLQASESVLLAIDGRSGSGKSDLASCLQMLFGASVAHMDDFFLPAARKTPQRLSQPGGNVDIERFTMEVAEPLRRGQPVCYRPYSCRTSTLGQPIPLPRAPLTVIEGVYSLHPALYHVHLPQRSAGDAAGADPYPEWRSHAGTLCGGMDSPGGNVLCSIRDCFQGGCML